MTLPELIDKLHSEEACYAHLEEVRWPEGVACVSCGSHSISRIDRVIKKRHGQHKGETYRRTVFECNACGDQFTATSGTIFHDTHLPLRTWFLAIHRIGESKKGVSAKQLERELGVTYKTAWYLCHRIREALLQPKGPGLKGIVEADETYVKGASIPKGETLKRGTGSQRVTPVVGAKERGGQVRAQVMPKVSQRTIYSFLTSTIIPEAAILHTDESSSYDLMAQILPHHVVNHSEWYVYGDVHTNGIESFWSLLKRGIVGSYHRLSVKHLQRYVDEYCWRSNHKDVADPFGEILGASARGRHITYAELVAPVA